MNVPEQIRKALSSHRRLELPDEGKRRAAVAMVLCAESGALRMLFIERSKREGDPWSGHLAFPGGQTEKDDRTFRHTAERETYEEISMDLSSAECLGQLDDVTGANLPVVVSGFVYCLTRPGKLVLNHEVHDAFWTDLTNLTDPVRHSEFRFDFQGAERTVPAIDLLGPGRPLLWGITYRFVGQFLGLLGHEIPGAEAPPIAGFLADCPEAGSHCGIGLNDVYFSTMTPRERIITALNHKTPDRTPTDGWFHHEVTDKLKSHYRTDDWQTVLAELGIEGWAELSPELVPAEKADQMAASKSTHASGTPAIWIDERTYEDNWGVRFRWGKDGRYHQWLSGPLEDAESTADIEGFRMLTIDDIREPGSYADRVAKLKREERFVYANLENPYRRFWNLRGLENALADYIINTELLEAVYDSLYPVYTELALRMTRAGVDMIRIVGDIAMQDRIIMGPELWRKYDKPRMAALIGACRSANPNIEIFFHSDGDLTALMDDLIEVGFSVLNPIQPECMDPSEVKRRWGDRITLHGCISIQHTLPFGTADEVRKEIEALIRECGHNGGLVLMPSNRIQPDTPVENIIACYHTARDYRLGG